MGQVSCQLSLTQYDWYCLSHIPSPWQPPLPLTDTSSNVTLCMSLSTNMLVEETFKLITCNMCSVAQYSDKMTQHSADIVCWELLIDSLLQPRDSLHNPPLLETLKQTLEPLTVMQSPETGTLKIDCATSILESPQTGAKLQPRYILQTVAD